MRKKLIPKGQLGIGLPNYNGSASQTVSSGVPFAMEAPRTTMDFLFNYGAIPWLSSKTAVQESGDLIQVPYRPIQKQFNWTDIFSNQQTASPINNTNQSDIVQTPEDTGKGANLSSTNGLIQKFNKFTNNGQGGLALAGIEGVSTALGLKPLYLMNNTGERIAATAEGISKNFGNPLVNSAGDAIAGGIGKLMGLNTDKVVGGGMAGVNTVSNVLSNFGPIGSVAGMGLKAINMIGGTNLEEFNTDSRVQRSSAYTGSAKKIQDTADKYGGAMVSGVDRLFGTDRKYKRRIREQKLIQQRVKGILNESDQALEASTGSADMFRLRNSMGMQDNSYMYNGVLAAKRGTRIKRIIRNQKGGQFESFRSSLPQPLQDTTYYRLRTLWDLGGKPSNFEAAKKLNLFEDVNGEYHAPSVIKNNKANEYLFLKVPSHPTVNKELDWYESDDAKDFRNQYELDKSGDVWKYILKNSSDIDKHAQGGKMNVIPEGALHAHKHHLDLDNTTIKGIPVISREDGGEITQHAEIERNEIVFTKEVSNKLEELWKQYNSEGLTKKERDQIAIQAGEIITFEIIENTDDRTGLLTTVD